MTKAFNDASYREPWVVHKYDNCVGNALYNAAYIPTKFFKNRLIAVALVVVCIGSSILNACRLLPTKEKEWAKDKNIVPHTQPAEVSFSDRRARFNRSLRGIFVALGKVVGPYDSLYHAQWEDITNLRRELSQIPNPEEQTPRTPSPTPSTESDSD